LATPLRALAQRFGYFGLIAAAAALMVLGKLEAPVVERVRTTVVDLLVPILDVLAMPVRAVTNLGDRMGAFGDLYAENRRLREETEQLMQWQVVARQLEAENRSLRELARFIPEDAVSFVTARVVAGAGGSFVRSILVTAGTRDGVAKGQIAMTGDGLVGRVGETGARASRVLLLTDLNSQIPVLLEGSRERAILAGDNSDAPHLVFLRPDFRPSIGDRVVTSGHGGVFPPALPIGVVSSIDDGLAVVRPFVDFSRIEHVRLVDYGVGGTLPVSAPQPGVRRPAR
jgi:rod shape-determining protein MreC